MSPGFGVVRWTMRGGLIGVAVCAAATSHAAELRWSSTEDCASAAQFVEQVEGQIGTRLAAVEGIDFEVVVTREAGDRWRLTLVSIEQPTGERRVRSLTGQSCAELTDAGAVALAMAIRAKTEDVAVPENAAPPEKPAPPARPAARPAKPPPSRPPPRAADRADPIAVFAAAGPVVDIGALPDPSFGIEVDIGVALRGVRLMAFGSAFAPDETAGTSGRGGQFQLWVAGALACLERGEGRFRALICAGYEIGALSAEGTGVSDPRSESATWQALRADLGAVLPLGSGVSGLVRAGATVPLARREFVIDASDVVHEPSSVTGRVMAGLSVDF